MTDLVARATERFDELMDDIEALVRLESPSNDLEAVGRSADLVTEMTLVKHPFRSGVKAQAGIEF